MQFPVFFSTLEDAVEMESLSTSISTSSPGSSPFFIIWRRTFPEILLPWQRDVTTSPPYCGCLKLTHKIINLFLVYGMEIFASLFLSLLVFHNSSSVIWCF